MYGILCLALALTGCASAISDLKAYRNPQKEKLHEYISESIHSYGFRHGVTSIREDEREIDTILVSIPLDSLKRQHESLHHMLFNVARLAARPEFAHLSIQIELNAGDDDDRKYMMGIVQPIIATAKNVKAIAQRDNSNDLVVSISTLRK